MNPLRLRWFGVPLVGAALALGSVAQAAAASKPAAAQTAYAPVVLSAATQARSFFYVNPPASLLTAGGVPFTLGNVYWLHFGDQPAAVTMNYDKPQAVYLLLNTSWTDAAFAGQTVGSVRLTFSDGTVRDTVLVVGANIREWESGSRWTANTLSSPATVSVWQGMAQAAVGGASATIDMLTIPAQSTAHLTGVTVTETSTTHMGIVFQGLTVLYDPLPCRPGNSGNTPAAVHSQAATHSQSLNFTCSGRTATDTGGDGDKDSLMQPED